jgi:hypothetical protein
MRVETLYGIAATVPAAVAPTVFTIKHTKEVRKEEKKQGNRGGTPAEDLEN